MQHKKKKISPNQSVSHHIKDFFYDNFNVKFKLLKKDTCNTCDSLKFDAPNEECRTFFRF